MVKVDVSQIIDGIGAAQPFSVITDVQGIGESESWIHGDIAVAGQIVNVGAAFRLTAQVVTQAQMECGRCLTEFELPVKFRFEEDFQASDIGVENDWIDIAEFIRAALIFQEPMQPLCDDACKGICFRCGADLNQVDCGCNKTVLDPRMAALGKLLEK